MPSGASTLWPSWPQNRASPQMASMDASRWGDLPVETCTRPLPRPRAIRLRPAHPDVRNKVSRYPQLFPRASHRSPRREGTKPTLPPTERAAMARRVAALGVSSVLSGVGRGQRAGVAAPSAVTIPARTSGGRLAHDATSRARSASGGAWPPPAFGRDVGGTGPPVGPPVRPRPAPRFGPGAASAAPGAARSSESAYSPGDSASARGFDSARASRPAHRTHTCAGWCFSPGNCLIASCLFVRPVPFATGLFSGMTN